MKRKNDKGVLLVYPDYPIPKKSINHKDYFPIGLLKIGSFLKNEEKYNNIMLVYGEQERNTITNQIGEPEQIFISSLFTYWSFYFYKTLDYYTKIFPRSRFIVGGIYVSLMTEKVKIQIEDYYSRYDVIIHSGLFPEAEDANLKYGPAIELTPNAANQDFFIVHTKRGCNRKCKFCGSHRLEAESCLDENQFYDYVMLLKSKYKSLKKIVFYDNNFLENNNSYKILEKIIYLKEKRIISNCESQSGFDGRLLNFELAKLLKKAGFLHPKIAWDGGKQLQNSIKNQIDYLSSAGYKTRDISVFMLYNYDIPFDDMIEKIKYCYDWRVQINDCRFRPLDSDNLDKYNPQKVSGQPRDEYYIHPVWEDWQIRLLRRLVRKGNIMTRMNWNSLQFNQWKLKKAILKKSNGSNSGFINNDIESYIHSLVQNLVLEQ